LKKLLFLLGLFTVLLYGYAYNDKLLQVYAKIIPRIALMMHPGETLPGNNIGICLLYEKGDEEGAQRLSETIRAAYPDGLRYRTLALSLFPYGEHRFCRDSHLLFLFDTDEARMRKSLDFAKAHRIPTMSYSSRFLDSGVMLSLYLGKTVRPYLNLEAAKENGFTPDSLLVRISKIYGTGGAR
jgi:hypothetical protein